MNINKRTTSEQRENGKKGCKKIQQIFESVNGDGRMNDENINRTVNEARAKQEKTEKMTEPNFRLSVINKT